MSRISRFASRLVWVLPALAIAIVAWVSPAAALTPEQVYDKVVTALEPLLLGSTEEKIAAAQTLGKLRALYSVPALKKAYEDPSPAVRKAVVQALSAIAHKSSVKVLIKAASDADVTVAETAIVALGEMHTDAAYEGLTKLLGKVKEEKLKKAALDGVRKWNKPFTPLPAPHTLPEGKKAPTLPEPKKPEPPPAEEKKPKEKKPKKKKPKEKPSPEPAEGKPEIEVEIEEIKSPPAVAKIEVKKVPAMLAPDEEAARQALDGSAHLVTECIDMHQIEPPFVPVKIVVTTGGHMSQLHVLRQLEPEAWDCVHGVVAKIEFPPASASYSVKYEFTPESLELEPEEGEPPPGKREPGPAMAAPPPLPLELWDMTKASFVTFEVATAKVTMPSHPQETSRIFSMQIRGGYLGKYIGAGLIVPFAGASSSLEASYMGDMQNNERLIFNNLGLWLRTVGRKTFGKVELSFGGALTLYFPTGTEVKWHDYGEFDKNFLPAMSSLYANYYRHGVAYPDLQNTFKTSIRPDFDLGIRIGMLSFQLEAGLDFIILGDAYNPDPFWMATRDVEEVYLFHLGVGAAIQPVPWLQLSLELTSVIELSGTSGQTWAFNTDEVGDPAGSEAFITPGVAVLLPVGETGAGHISLGLRVPLGEAGSSSGSLQLDPILLVSTGFRFY